MFGVELDIRTLAFVATLSAIIQALTFSSLWMVSRRDNATTLWAVGGIANAIGFILLGLRGFIPDLASVVAANTLIAAGHAFYLFGLQVYTNKKPAIGLSESRLRFMLRCLSISVRLCRISPCGSSSFP